MGQALGVQGWQLRCCPWGLGPPGGDRRSADGMLYSSTEGDTGQGELQGSGVRGMQGGEMPPRIHLGPVTGVLSGNEDFADVMVKWRPYWSGVAWTPAAGVLSRRQKWGRSFRGGAVAMAVEAGQCSARPEMSRCPRSPRPRASGGTSGLSVQLSNLGPAQKTSHHGGRAQPQGQGPVWQPLAACVHCPLPV